MNWAQVPAPKRGGTFWYCPWNCYLAEKVGSERGTHRTRFRKLKTYRRHASRIHGHRQTAGQP